MSTTIAYTDVDGRSYNIHYSYAGTTAKVTQCNAADTPSGTKVVIPSTINVGGTDYTVDTIASPGFSQNNNVYSIELPTTMTTLEGTNTFYNTRNLSEVIGLENTGITYLPQNAFNHSGNVGNNNVNVFTPLIVNISNITTIGIDAFAYSSIQNVTIKDGYQHTLYGQFQHCPYLREVTFLGAATFPNNGNGFPDGGAMFNATYYHQNNTNTATDFINNGIEKVTFNSGFTTLPVIFKDNRHITKADLPDTLTTMTSHAFHGCINLNMYVFPKSLTTFFKSDDSLKQLFYYDTNPRGVFLHDVAGTFPDMTAFDQTMSTTTTIIVKPAVVNDTNYINFKAAHPEATFIETGIVPELPPSRLDLEKIVTHQGYSMANKTDGYGVTKYAFDADGKPLNPRPYPDPHMNNAAHQGWARLANKFMVFQMWLLLTADQAILLTGQLYKGDFISLRPDRRVAYMGMIENSWDPDALASGQLTLNQWTHIAVVNDFSTGEFKIFYNAVEQSTGVSQKDEFKIPFDIVDFGTLHPSFSSPVFMNDLHVSDSATSFTEAHQFIMKHSGITVVPSSGSRFTFRLRFTGLDLASTPQATLDSISSAIKSNLSSVYGIPAFMISVTYESGSIIPVVAIDIPGSNNTTDNYDSVASNINNTSTQTTIVSELGTAVQQAEPSLTQDTSYTSSFDQSEPPAGAVEEALSRQSVDLIFTNHLNESITALSLAIPVSTPPLTGIDATVVVPNISVALLQNTFYFKTDTPIATDATDDVHCYVDTTQWASMVTDLNAMSGTISIAQGAYVNSDVISQDFLRNVANGLFGTHLGVDLFNNETVIRENLETQTLSLATTIQQKITEVSIGGTNQYLVTDADGNKYFPDPPTDGSPGPGTEDVTRALLTQLLQSAPSRFSNLSSYEITGKPGFYKMPLAAGDSVSYAVTINPHADQNTNVNTGSQAGPRKYRVKLVLE
jgi:hypothetical protein